MRRLVGLFRVVSRNAGQGACVERVTHISGGIDINTLPLSGTHGKSLCFQYLRELLFLCLTHKFSVPLFRRLGTDFSDSLIKIHRYICYASVSVASVLHKGLGLSQQAKTDTARQEPDLAVFRECGHTP